MLGNYTFKKNYSESKIFIFDFECVLWVGEGKLCVAIGLSLGRLKSKMPILSLCINIIYSLGIYYLIMELVINKYMITMDSKSSGIRSFGYIFIVVLYRLQHLDFAQVIRL